jgi:hypothetical protein
MDGWRRVGTHAVARVLHGRGAAQRTRAVQAALEPLARGGALDRGLKRRREHRSGLGLKLNRGELQQLVQRRAAAAGRAQPACGGGAAAAAACVGRGRDLRAAEGVGPGGNELCESVPAAEGEHLWGRRSEVRGGCGRPSRGHSRQAKP